MSLMLRIISTTTRAYPFVKGQGRIGQWNLVKQAFSELSSPVSTKTKEGFTIRVDPHDYLGRMLVLFGQHERDNLRAIKMLMSDKSVFWDIGANYGYFSLAVSNSFPRSEVISIEPQAKVADLFKRSVEDNTYENIEIIEAAMGEKPGFAFLAVPEERLANASISKNQTAGAQKVPIETLDGLSERYPIPDVIKIDVEGHEVPVLQGGPKVLAHKPAVLAEVNRARFVPLIQDPCVKFLCENGYSIHYFKKNALHVADLELPLPKGIHDIVAIGSS